MKFRKDFVTNSSSSSFIAVSNDDCSDKIEHYRAIIDDVTSVGILEDGNGRFGWDPAKYSDFSSKFNYIVIQAIESKNSNELQIKLNEMFSSDLGISIDWNAIKEKVDSSIVYIDHQSALYENDDLEDFLFGNEGRLRRFLYNDDSCVIMGNDNRYDYHDSLEDPYMYNNDFECYRV